MKKYFLLLIIGVLSMLYSCQSYKASTYNYPEPVDTNDKVISLQEKKQYSLEGVYADNRFDGARLNDFIKIDSSTFKAFILPENTPINESPWYAFKIWADSNKTINLILDYDDVKHRYIPKLSKNRIDWTAIDTNSIIVIDSSEIQFSIDLDSVALFVSAQELITSEDIYAWSKVKEQHKDVRVGQYGLSVNNKKLVFLDIWNESSKDKPMVVILSRQHPPEITGYMAMEKFVETLLEENVLAKAFRDKYRIMVFPLLNPDGVDLGNWRHNAHGIDLNRDWAYYRQPEISQLVDFIVKQQKTANNDVILGIDFHSTQKDIFYTYTSDLISVIPGFKDYWIYGIDQALPGYTPVDEPSGLSKPYSKVWFYTQFRAEGITYEIGDETPRDFILQKAEVAATEMMKLLLFYADD